MATESLRIGQISGQTLLIEQVSCFIPHCSTGPSGPAQCRMGTSDTTKGQILSVTSKGRKRLREETEEWKRQPSAKPSTASFESQRQRNGFNDLTINQPSRESPLLSSFVANFFIHPDGVTEKQLRPTSSCGRTT
jgi:hypothetical protein